MDTMSMIRRTGVALGCLALLSGIPAGPTFADQIDLDFLPPDLDVEPVCIARDPDGAVIERWTDWDGTALLHDDPDLVRRDMVRLRYINPVGFYDTIDRIITLLPAVDEEYSDNHALVDRISLMIEANRTEDLSNQRLVRQLMAGEATLSPRFLNLLGGYLIEGIGIEADPDRGYELLKSSAYAGNADALLRLAGRDLANDPVDGWDVPPELAITMAFGSLVGELNPTICDRIWRIAREFHNGDLVEKSPATAEAWFRFAADLGDASAAWEVFGYHVEAEGMEKDNDILVEYLTKAAEGGLPYARLELGRLYEEGALVDPDFDAALVHYREAARYDNMPGLTRLARVLDENVRLRPDLAEERATVLADLASRPTAPGWVFVSLAEDVLIEKGRWAGEAEARDLLEEAISRGETEALERYGKLLLTDRRDPETFTQALDLLERAVAEQGSVNAMDELHSALTCVAPDGPHLGQSQYWRDLEDATDTETLTFTAEDFRDAPWAEDDVLFAQIQSQALYGRPKSLANFLTIIENDPTLSSEIGTFWSRYSEGYDRVLRARANIALDLADSSVERQAALNLMRQAVNEGDVEAAVELASSLISAVDLAVADLTPEGRAEAEELLRPLAESGSGDALNLLLSLQRATPEAAQSLYQDYGSAIDARGDFEALLFALPNVPEDQRAIYLDRALSVMICDFKSTLQVAQTMDSIGEAEATAHWLDIAGSLVGDDAWAVVELADTYRALIGPDAIDRAVDLYAASYDAGYHIAGFRLLSVYGDPLSGMADEVKRTDLFIDMLETVEPDALPNVLSRLKNASEDTLAAVSGAVDVRDRYLTAAKAGHVLSMVEYARITRDEAADVDDLEDAISWLERAAALDSPPAMFELAQSYAFGIGLDASREKAIDWLERAAALDHEAAADFLGLLRLQGELGQ